MDTRVFSHYPHEPDTPGQHQSLPEVQLCRNAAIEITKITTTKPPHPKQVVYGDRATDMWLGFPLGLVRDFDMSKFFGVQPLNRISTVSSSIMIKKHLDAEFGECPNFTIEIADNMKEKMLEDLRTGRKEEYMSKIGLAILFDRAGGKLTEKMSEAIAAVEVENTRHQEIIREIRSYWDQWDLADEVQGDERLQFDSFYHGFMAPYFGCYRCPDTKQALQALDMDTDGYVDWNEFLVYIKWALRQYPDLERSSEVLEVAFEKGIIPAMRDEMIKTQ